MAEANIQAQRPIRGYGSNKCPHHPGQEVIYVCEDCEGELACVKCAISIHKRHALEGLSEIIPEVNRNIQDCVTKLEQTDIPHITVRLQTVNNDVLKEEQYNKEQIEKIEEKHRSLTKELDNIKGTLVQMFKDNEQHNVDALRKHEKEIQSQLKELRSKLDELKETLRSGNDVLRYDVARKLPSCLKKIPYPTCQRKMFVACESPVEQLQKLYGEVLIESSHPSASTTVEEMEDLRKVLNRQHKLDGKSLTLSEYIPPPSPKSRPLYEDKVVVKGLNPQTSKERLQNFIEAKTGATLTDLLYGEEEGVVLISFEEPLDFDKLQNACKKRSLDGCYLHVQRVPISNCIMVTGISPKTSGVTFKYYFEDPRRSGGGYVDNVKLNEEEGFCLVYFEDHTLIDGVCKRNHVIDGSTLQVHLYHDMLGEATSAEEGPKFKVPEPVMVTTIDERKVQFLLCSKVNKVALETQLKSVYTQIIWPSEFTGPLKLKCLLTKDTKDLAKTWKKTSNECLNKFLNYLAVQQIEVLQSIWPNVITGLQSLIITHPDAVAVVVENVSFRIIVIGHKQFVEDLAEQIIGIIKAISQKDDLDRTKRFQKLCKTNITIL